MTMKIGLVLIVLLATSGFKPEQAQAQSSSSKTTRTTTTTTVTSESTDESSLPTQTPTPSASAPSETPVRESSVSAHFGSKGQSGLAGCKTEELSRELIQDLKGDCAAWIKDQKATLKDRFLVSSCDDSCEDCGMGLRRCSVTGTVRFTLK